ncbi:MAG: helix-turn-helix domain-containing protein [Clostridia bacterium]|nr:helix-turn-helix domain-containing protein [Clostridia bacterium]
MFYNEDELPAVLTFEEAREYLFIGRNTMLDVLHSGKLKGFKVGKKWRIRKDDLIEFTKS